MRAHGPQSVRRLFVLFTIIGFLVFGLLYSLGLAPQASEIGTAVQAQTGTLRLVSTTSNALFYLRTVSSDGKVEDLTVTGATDSINVQLLQYVNKGEVILEGQPNAPSRRPGIIGFTKINLYITRVTPPTVAAIPCDNSGSKLDILYLIDASGSMDDQPNIFGRVVDTKDRPDNLVKQFASEAKTKMRDGSDRMGYYTFSNSNVSSEISTNLTAVTDLVRNIRYGRDNVNSNVDEGVEQGSRTLQARPQKNVPAIVIVLADNQSDVSSKAFTIAQDDYKNRNVRYFAVSLGGNRDGLKQLAEAGGGQYFNITDDDNLKNVVKSMFEAIDKPYGQCISIAAQSNKAKIRGGGKMTMSYVVTNNSRKEITNAIIKQTLPDGYFLAESNNSPLNTIADISIGTLKPGESHVREVTVNVKN